MLRERVLQSDATRARRQDAEHDWSCIWQYAPPSLTPLARWLDAPRGEAKTNLVNLPDAARLALLASLAQSTPARLECLLCGRAPVIKARGERPSALAASQTAQDDGAPSGARAAEDKGAAARLRRFGSGGGGCPPGQVCGVLPPGPEDSLPGPRGGINRWAKGGTDARRVRAQNADVMRAALGRTDMQARQRVHGISCLAENRTKIRAPLQTRSRDVLQAGPCLRREMCVISGRLPRALL